MKWGSIGKAFALVGLAVVVIALCACPVTMPAPVTVALACVAVYACYAAAQVLRDASNESTEPNCVPLTSKQTRSIPVKGHKVDSKDRREQLSHGGIPFAKGLYV